MAPHERLEAWRYAHRLTIEVYRATRSWPTEERYGLSAQVRRCAYSVPANMVEGAAKRGRKEFARYLDISLGSHAELGYGLRLAEDLGYLSGEMLENRKPCTPRLAVSLAGSMRRSPAADGNLRLSTFLPSYRPTVLPSYRPNHPATSGGPPPPAAGSRANPGRPMAAKVSRLPSSTPGWSKGFTPYHAPANPVAS